ncbi:MAG: hypothetical protein R3C45_02145 [Phycisphaerales bacterium]
MDQIDALVRRVELLPVGVECEPLDPRDVSACRARRHGRAGYDVA